MRRELHPAPTRLATLFAVIATFLLLLPSRAEAKDFYVDPQTGSTKNDGSAAKPWRTLQEVIDAKLVSTRGWDALPYKAGAKLVAKNASGPIKAGDTIWLRSGYHGTLTISGHYNSAVITVAAEKGQTPRFSKVLVRSSSNWHFRGLEISPSFAPTYKKDQMLTLQAHSYQGPLELVTVEGCKLFSVPSITAWSAKDWNDKAANGIAASGTKVTLRNNRLENVNFGISVSATYSLVIGNWIENFAGDGMRGLGDHTVFERNTVQNCYDVNANHDDGFQSWSVGADKKVGTGQVVGIVLRGNRIINYTDPNQPMRCTLQGIGCFDGMFVDWVIENNVIITDHWHGITLLGAKNVRVVNNTVLDPNGTKPGPPWVRISKHKNGTAASGCVVRNNLVTALNNDAVGVVVDHNIVIKDASKHFVDVAGYDLHLLAGSAAIDKGSSQLAPARDADGVPRPQGAEVDVGAYEWSKNPPPSLDAGGLDAGAGVDAARALDGGAGGDAAGAGDGVVATDGRSSDRDLGATDAAGAAPPDQGCNCGVAGGEPRGLWLLLLLGMAAWVRTISRRPSSERS